MQVHCALVVPLVAFLLWSSIVSAGGGHGADAEEEVVSVPVTLEPESAHLMANLVALFSLNHAHHNNFSLETAASAREARTACYTARASLCTTVGESDDDEPVHGNITWLPLFGSAMVPIVHMHVGRNELPITLTPSLVARILMGFVTYWNDTAIVAEQSSLRDMLPSEPITVVLSTKDHHSHILMSMMRAAEPELFNQTFGPNPNLPLQWPRWRYASHVNATVASVIVASTMATFSVVPFAEALRSGVTRALMRNSRGHSVECTALSLTLALANAADSKYISEESRLAVTAVSAWPMSYAVYVGLHNSHSTITSSYTDCAHTQTSIIEFLRFTLSDEVVGRFAAAYGFAPVPALAATAVLNDELKCDGEPVLVFEAGNIVLTGPSAFVLASHVWSAVYVRNTGIPVTVHIESNDLAIDVVRDVMNPAAHDAEHDRHESAAGDEAIVGMVSPIHLNANATARALIDQSLADSVTPNSLVVTPVLMYAVTPVFHFADNIDSSPLTTASVANGTAAPGLVLTMDLLSGIFNASIGFWTDAALVALNPFLTGMFAGKASDIRVVICCDHGEEGVRTAAAGDLFTRILSGGTSSLPFDWSEIIQRAPERFVIARDERGLADIVLTTDNAIGYRLKQTPAFDVASEIAVAMDVAPDGQRVVHRASLARMAECANTRGFASLQSGAHPFMPRSDPSRTATAHASAVGVDTSAIISIAQAQCWPFHDVLAFASLRHFTMAATPVDTHDSRYLNNQCTAGQRALRLVEWLLMQADSPTFLSFEDLSGFLFFHASPATGPPTPLVHAAALASLYSITCDGRTLLRTFPDRWVVSSSLTNTSRAFAVIGYVLSIATLLGLWRFRHAQTFVASSVPFMAVTCVGLMLVYSCIPSIFLPVLSLSTCSAFLWLANLGFTLTFAPLFIKQWRVYRIFDNKKLGVVKLNNTLLFMVTGALVTFDVMVLATWQVLAPIQPFDQVVVDGDRSTIYETCAIPATSSWQWVFPALMVSEKGSLLLFGAYIGMSSRRVQLRYSESNAIAYSIYNVVFMAFLLVVVWYTLRPVGDSRLTLLLIVLAWPTLMTWGLLFLPRFFEAFGLTRGDKHSLTDVHNWFSMFSCESMPYDMLVHYVAALQKELAVAHRQLASVSKPKSIHLHLSSSPNAAVVGGTEADGAVVTSAPDQRASRVRPTGDSPDAVSRALVPAPTGPIPPLPIQTALQPGASASFRRTFGVRRPSLRSVDRKGDGPANLTGAQGSRLLTRNPSASSMATGPVMVPEMAVAPGPPVPLPLPPTAMMTAPIPGAVSSSSVPT